MNRQTSVLYVDDEEALSELVKSALESFDFTVEVADDGDTALDILAERSFDVILLDICMPRMGGIEVLRHLRQKGVKSRIIMLTGVDDLTIAIETVKNGIDDYLRKPFDIKRLVGCIERVMKRKVAPSCI